MQSTPPADPGIRPLASAPPSDVVFNKVVWFNTLILACVFGVACGFVLLLATYLSIALNGAEAGRYLNLLSVFLPGYSATPFGAWIGFFWGFVFAALSGGVVYQIYARSAGRHWAKTVAFDVSAPRSVQQLTLVFSAPALGFAIGAMLALQLFASTAWLVLRGTADESPHAALLSQYLPGYIVSIPGAFIGAFWLFAYGFCFSYLFAIVYNFLVGKRRGGSDVGGR